LLARGPAGKNACSLKVRIILIIIDAALLHRMRAMLLTGAMFDEKYVSSVEYGRIEKLRKSA
jgi:hypothetical protein